MDKNLAQVIQRGFLFLKGSSHNYSFLEAKHNEIRKDVFVPVSHLIKVQEEPIIVFSVNSKLLGICLERDSKKASKEISEEEGFEAYGLDVMTFMLVPDGVNPGENTDWRRYLNGSLLYHPSTPSLNLKDLIYPEISEITTRDVFKHLYAWMNGGHVIYNSEENGFFISGILNIGRKQFLEATVYGIIHELEERYQTKMI